MQQMRLRRRVKNVADGVVDAYADPNFVPDGFVRASHIIFLAADDAARKADALKARIEAGELSFEAAALQFSACPTRDLDGALGTFESLSRLRDGTLRGVDSLPYDGKDTSEFDALVQSCALGAVHRCASQWGEHLVRVDARGSEACGAARRRRRRARERGFGGGAARRRGDSRSPNDARRALRSSAAVAGRRSREQRRPAIARASARRRRRARRGARRLASARQRALGPPR